MYKQINSNNITELIMTKNVCFDKTGTLTNEQIKLKYLLYENS